MIIIQGGILTTINKNYLTLLSNGIFFFFNYLPVKLNTTLIKYIFDTLVNNYTYT